MPSPYAYSSYVERDLDQKISEVALGWLGSTSSIQWLSLNSAPGRGNSWLLEHLQQFTLSNKLNFDGIEKILIKGSYPDHSPDRLGPLSNELYSRYLDSRMKPWRRLKRRIRNAGPRRLLAFGLVLLACLCVGFLLAGLEQYAQQTSDIEWTGEFFRWFGTFWYDFIPHNWQRFPLWLFTKSIAGLPLTILGAAFFALIYRARRRQPSHLGSRDSEDEDLEFFKSTGGSRRRTD